MPVKISEVTLHPFLGLKKSDTAGIKGNFPIKK